MSCKYSADVDPMNLLVLKAEDGDPIRSPSSQFSQQPRKGGGGGRKMGCSDGAVITPRHSLHGKVATQQLSEDLTKIFWKNCHG